MIATRFRSVYWVGGVAVAALGCYLVSQRVAAERLMLAHVETEIVAGQRSIRSLKTEIGTRAGLNQIERWNLEVLALQAPKPAQYVDSEVQLAALVQPVQPAMDAPSAIVAVAATRAAEDTLPGITRASYMPDVAPRVARVEHKPVSLAKAEPKAGKVEKAAAHKPKADKPKVVLARADKPKAGASKAEKTTKAAPKHDRAEVRLAKAEASHDRDNTPRVRSAVYMKPGRDHQNVALLDDKLMGDLNRIASRERVGSKRER